VQVRLGDGCSVNFSQQHNAIHSISSGIKNVPLSAFVNDCLTIFSNFFEATPSKKPRIYGAF